PPRHQRLNPCEAELAEIKPINESVDRPNRIVFRHIIVQQGREQCALAAIAALHETCHRWPRRFTKESYHQWSFHTGWGESGHLDRATKTRMPHRTKVPRRTASPLRWWIAEHPFDCIQALHGLKTSCLAHLCIKLVVRITSARSTHVQRFVNIRRH